MQFDFVNGVYQNQENETPTIKDAMEMAAKLWQTQPKGLAIYTAAKYYGLPIKDLSIALGKNSARIQKERKQYEKQSQS